MSNQPPPLPPPMAGYSLRRPLGRGAFGEVWEAEAPGGVDVAVKILHRTLQPESAQRELEALHVIKGLRHLHLLPVQAFYALDDRLFVVLELADGSLRQRLRACRDAGLPGIPADELLGYLGETAEALDFLHVRKVIHRDIKPDNLLLVGSHVKVADYGLARLLDATSLRTASVVGTPLYMAPEVWRNKVTFATDQYALACTYAELRTNRYPFPGSQVADLMYSHLTREPDLDVPEPERQVILRALAKDAAERYPTCVAFVEALKAAARQPAGRAADPGGWNRRVKTPRRRTSRPLIVAGVLAVAALGLVAWRPWERPAPDGTGDVASDRGIVDPPKEAGAGADRTTDSPGPAAVAEKGHALVTGVQTQSDAARFLLIGRALLEGGHFDGATSAARQMVAALSHTAEALAWAKKESARLVADGRAAIDLREYDSALLSAEAARKLTPGDAAAEALRVDAVAAQSAAILKKARAESGKLAEKGPTGDMPTKAQLASATGKLLTDLLADVNKLEADEFAEKGRVAFKQGRFSEAVTSADAALKLLPGHAPALALKKEASKPSPVGRWLADQDSMGARVTMDLRIEVGGTWKITVSLSGNIIKQQEGTFELLAGEQMSLGITEGGTKGKPQTLTYSLSGDRFEMPNPNSLTELLKFKRAE